MIRIGSVLSIVALFSLAQADEPHKLQRWETLGLSAGSAYGETLLEVQDEAGGAVVRMVYVGLRDVACGGMTVMAWEKHIPQSLVGLAKPLKLCQIRGDLERLEKRHVFGDQGTEHDVTAVIMQCGTQRQVSGISLLFNDLAKRTADYRYMNLVWALDAKVMKAAWGANLPDITVIDPNAERDGENLVAGTGRIDYEKDEPFDLWRHFLSSYKGPLGKPIYEWRIETPPGVKILHYNEPSLYRSAFGVGVKSDSKRLALTVDPHSGKVTKSEGLVGGKWASVATQELRGDSMTWVFDPATVPIDGLVKVTAEFKAECGKGRY